MGLAVLALRRPPRDGRGPTEDLPQLGRATLVRRRRVEPRPHPAPRRRPLAHGDQAQVPDGTRRGALVRHQRRRTAADRHPSALRTPFAARGHRQAVLGQACGIDVSPQRPRGPLARLHPGDRTDRRPPRRRAAGPRRTVGRPYVVRRPVQRRLPVVPGHPFPPYRSAVGFRQRRGPGPAQPPVQRAPPPPITGAGLRALRMPALG